MRIVQANPAACALTGYDLKALLGLKIPDLHPTADPDKLEILLGRIMSGGSVRVEGELLREDGGKTSVELSNTRVVINGLPYVHTTARDITERKAAETALRESEERFKGIFEGSRDAVFIVDREARFAQVNHAACALTGYDREELLAMRIPDLHETDDLHAFETFFDRIMAGEAVVSESDILRKDGVKVATEFSNARIVIGDAAYMHTTARDITERKAAEAALRESEERFRALFEHNAVVMLLIDPENGAILDANNSAAAFYGWSREELKAMRIFDINPAPPSKTRADMAAALEKEKQRFLIRHRLANGDIRDVAVRSSPILRQERNILHAIVFDVTKRKRAEAALRESEERFRKLVESAPMMIMLVRDGKYVYANPAALRAMGYADVEEINGMDAMALVDPEYKPMMRERMRRTESGGNNPPVEVRIIRADGEPIWSISTSVSVVMEGEPMTVVVGQDITEWKKAEDRLRFQAYLLDAVEQAVVVTDAEGRVVYWNPFAEKLYGWSADEAIGRTTIELIAGDGCAEEGEAAQVIMKTRLQNGEGWSGDYLSRRKDGKPIHVNSTCTPIRDESGRLTHIVGISFDISERKAAEERLRESEERFRAVFENAAVGIAIADPSSTTILDCNAAIERFLAYAKGEMIGKSVRDITHPDDLPTTERLLREMAAGEWISHRVEKRYITKTGATVWADLALSMIRDAAGAASFAVAIVQNITERKAAEEQRELLISAIEQAAETVVITDVRGSILYANPAFERTTGYEREAAMGKNPRLLKSGEHDPSFYRDMWDTLKRGETWNGRFINRRKDGSLYTEEAVISPVRDNYGRTVNYVAVKRDITEELRLAEELRQAQKMESIGRLAGGVAHDMNNMLTPILGFSELLLEETLRDDPRRGLVEEITRAGLRARDLVRQLLAFSRKQTLAFQAVDLNDLLKNFEKLLRRTIREDIDIRLALAPELPFVQADVGQLEQVIMNLAVNAQDAMPDGGLLTIETGEVVLDAGDVTEGDAPVIGPHVLLSMGDTGCGMDAGTLERIFEPFFTTKPKDKGTGLGLSTVYGIIKQHGGSIRIESRVEAGSTFRIYLPVTKKSGESTGTEVDDAKPISGVGGSGTILLVEDDESVRKLAASVLKKSGYRVLEAENGRDALDILDRFSGPPDLLVTDVVMPEMNGRELFERLSRLYPGMRALFMSGYTDDVIDHHGVLDYEDEGVHFIHKPFTVKTLVAKVQELIRG